MQCSHSKRIYTETHTVKHMRMDGKLKKLSMIVAEYVSSLEFEISAGADCTPNLQYVAQLIGADEKDIIFTSGATESNNMIIKGVARFHKEKKRHIITLQTVCTLHTNQKPF